MAHNLNLSDSAGMLENCFYVDIEDVPSEIAEVILASIRPLMTNKKLKIQSCSCGEFRWIEIAPYVVMRHAKTDEYFVFKARRMTQSEHRRAVESIIGATP